jgi:hypothetical protein
MCFVASRYAGRIERAAPAEADQYDPRDEMAAGTIDDSIRDTGQCLDAESNLVVGENRCYDPAAGHLIRKTV